MMFKKIQFFGIKVFFLCIIVKLYGIKKSGNSEMNLITWELNLSVGSLFSSKTIGFLILASRRAVGN